MSPSAATRRRRRAHRVEKRVTPAEYWPVKLDPAADYDTVGRKQPQRLDFIHFARAIPGYAAQFAGRVPGSFYVQVDATHIDVACPCGASPPPRCELRVPTPCECDRIFVWTGPDVRVAGGPA